MSPRTTPTSSPRHNSSVSIVKIVMNEPIAHLTSNQPSYMQPTKASQARSSCPASPKLAVATAKTAVVDDAPAQQEVEGPLVAPFGTTDNVPPIASTAAMAPEAVNTIAPTTPMAHTVKVSLPSLDSSNLSNRNQETDDRSLSATAPAQIFEHSIPSLANDSMPDSAHVLNRSWKRKRPDCPKSLEVECTAEDADKSSIDEEPVAKKHKTRSSTANPEEFLELGSDDEDDVVVITQQNRKTAKARASKVTVEESKAARKPYKPSGFERLMNQEKIKALAAKGNIFARNPKLKRSYADTKSASRMSRPRLLPTQVITIAPPAKIPRPPVLNDSSTAEVAPGAITHDDNTIHVDLRTIKYINVTSNIRNVHISRIVEFPSAYPNVEIEFDEKDRPIKAHIAKMTSEEYKHACDAALHLEKDKRKQNTKLARQNELVGRKSSLHKTTGSKIVEKSSSRKVAASKGTEKSSLNKVASGKITRQPRKSRAQS
jgi:hypothetical protein